MKTLFLTGLRGSGKSTVGRDLSLLLGRQFIDLDQYLAVREKMNIDEVVARWGWQKFRDLEKDCLREVCALRKDKPVIATGGGIVLDKDNRELMKKEGLVIWLTCHPEILSQRLLSHPLPGQRPALSDKGLFEEMEDLSRKRYMHYLDSAHYIIDGEKESGEICSLIQNILPVSQV